jgi:hypothetical protein
VAESVADHAFDAIAADGMGVDLSRYRQAQARLRVPGLPMQGEHGQCHAPALLEYAVEVRARPNPRCRREAER